MTTALKSPPVAEQIARQAFDVRQAAEEILFNLESRHALNSVQLEILRQAGIEGVDAIERELGRIEQAKIWMQRAGTAVDLRDAEKEMIEAGRVHREQAPDLEMKIEALQAQLAKLNDARNAAAERFNAFTTARERLRQVAPKFVQEAGEFDRQAAVFPYSARMREIQGTLDLLQQLERIDPNSQQAELHFEAIGRERGVKPNYRGVEPVLWHSYVKGRLAERPALERELAELQGKCRQAVENLGDPLGYYIRKLG